MPGQSCTPILQLPHTLPADHPGNPLRTLRPRADPNEWTNLAGDFRLTEIKGDLARWVPEHEAPPVPGMHARFLEQRDGLWYWEGQPIVPEK